MPPDVSSHLARFNTGKTALKNELLQALIAFDQVPAEQRADRFENLAVEHARRLAALEEEAETIRQLLDAMPETPAPWVPPLSPGLRERIARYNHDRAALLSDYSAAQLRAAARSRSRGQNEAPTERRSTEVREAARQFEADHADAIEALRDRYDRIRRDLVAAADGLADPRNGQPLTVDALLDAYRMAMQRFDTIGREEAMYERYKIAMLQPGLSPPQRRLLFRAAHANLAQPLPRGEVMRATSSRPAPRS